MNGAQKKASKTLGVRLRGACAMVPGILVTHLVTHLVVKCLNHPWYKAIRAPRADCEACRYIFENRDPDRPSYPPTPVC